MKHGIRSLYQNVLMDWVCSTEEFGDGLLFSVSWKEPIDPNLKSYYYITDFGETYLWWLNTKPELADAHPDSLKNSSNWKQLWLARLPTIIVEAIERVRPELLLLVEESRSASESVK